MACITCPDPERAVLISTVTSLSYFFIFSLFGKQNVLSFVIYFPC